MSVTRPPIQRGRGDRDAHPARRAVADEPDGVDRLACAARGHHDVPALEVGVVGRLDQWRAAAGIGGPDRTLGHGGHDGLHDRRDLGEAAHARLSGGQRTSSGARSCSRSRHPAGPRWSGSPDGSTCRRPSPARRRPAPRRPGRWRSRRRLPGRWPSPRASGPSPVRRRSHRRCRPRRCGRSVRPAAGPAGPSRPGGGTVRRTSAAHEVGRRRGQHHRDIGALRAQGRTSSTAL